MKIKRIMAREGADTRTEKQRREKEGVTTGMGTERQRREKGGLATTRTEKQRREKGGLAVQMRVKYDAVWTILTMQ